MSKTLPAQFWAYKGNEDSALRNGSFARRVAADELMFDPQPMVLAADDDVLPFIAVWNVGGCAGTGWQ